MGALCSFSAEADNDPRPPPTCRCISSPFSRPGSRTRISSCSAPVIQDVHEIIDGVVQPIPRPSKAYEPICEALENALREHLACSLEQVFTARDRRPLCTDRSTLYPDFWVSILCGDPAKKQRVAYPGPGDRPCS